ncbi:MAG: VOC family protein, partial [Pseudomonadota bacterium]
MITGVNHITLAVRDVDASYAFYVDTLGLTPVAKWPTGAYFTAGETWIAIVADEHARDATLPEYSHVAFSVSPAEYQALG